MVNRFLASLMAVLLAVCVYAGAAGGSQIVTEAVDADTVNIAVVYPTASIDSSTYFWQGIMLAADRINQAGGLLGRELSLLKLDDKGSVTEGISIAQSICNSGGIDAVIGHWNSRVTIPAAAIYEHAGVVMITPAATSPELTEFGYSYVFQQVTDDREIGRQMAQLLAAAGYKRMAAYYADDAYGRGLINSFEDHGQEKGIYLVDRTSFMGNDMGAARLVTTWNALEAEAMLIADVLPEAGEAIRRLKSAGLSIPIIGATGLDRLDFIASVGDAAEGTMVASLFDPRDNRVEVQEFVDLFQENYHALPDMWAVQGYDTLSMLATVIQEMGSTDPSLIAEGLRSLENYLGVGGQLYFDERGRVFGTGVILKRVSHGQFVYLPKLSVGGMTNE